MLVPDGSNFTDTGVVKKIDPLLFVPTRSDYMFSSVYDDLADNSSARLREYFLQRMIFIKSSLVRKFLAH